MRIIKIIIKLTIAFFIIFLIANIPMTTKQGVDGVVVVKKIPFYIKVFEFISRDYEYSDLVKSIISGKSTDEEKVNAIFDWTVQNIKRVPQGFPVYDDHIWNIIIRQYGEADQMSDVFTTLSSYAGYPAFCDMARIGYPDSGISLSFVRIKEKWHMFDVQNKQKFIEGTLLDRPTVYGPPYRVYMDEVDKNTFNNAILRPDKQKILPRIIFEIKKLFLRPESLKSVICKEDIR